jgi:Protein of unknown function (DUF4236)
MPFRFRKRLRLFKGAWINLSKRGASLSMGRKGAPVNLNFKGVQETVGLPGSGLSYRTKLRKFGKPAGAADVPHGAVTVAHVVYLVLIALVILWILTHVH